MPTAYTKNKVHIYKWRDQNRATYRLLNNLHNQRYYLLKKEMKLFRNILIDF